MMRNYLVIFSLFLSMFSFGQGQTNPFAGENTNNNTSNRYSRPQSLNNGNGPGATGVPSVNASEQGKLAAANNGPGNPNTPLPIDDYIPLIILVALGLIVYQTRSAKNVKV